MTKRLVYDKHSQQEWFKDLFAHQATIPEMALPEIPNTPLPEPESNESLPDNGQPNAGDRKKQLVRACALLLVLVLGIILYLIWQPGPTKQAPTSTYSPNGTAPATNTTSADTIQVYVVGAVRHPGIYTLPADARMHQLLEAAGGPLPNANLVSLNLAARLHDGQEVYVTTVGEKQPGLTDNTSGTDNLVNINSATADEMKQQLNISSTTAQQIITYRTQHGAYNSVEELATVVSKTIYDKIKDKVTV